jgi:hypothetical protein
METVIPCSDDFRHPDGTVVTVRLLPHLFFGDSGGSSYPASSPLRCHSCMLHFSGPPVFIASSIQYHPVRGQTTQMTIEVTGHYCSFGCRNRALDEMDGAQSETYRLNTVRMDMEAFGLMPDYTIACPAPRDLDVFGGNAYRVADLEAVRASCQVSAELARRVPSSIRWVYRLRGVRETWFGKLEGGEGRAAILDALWKDTTGGAPEIRSGPASDGGPDEGRPSDAKDSEGSPSEAKDSSAGPWVLPARMHDPDALASFLEGQPGSPRLAVDGGRHLAVWPRLPVGETRSVGTTPSGAPRSRRDPAPEGQGDFRQSRAKESTHPPLRCWWCAGVVDPACPFKVPHHRDLLNTIHLEGWFDTPGCGLAWLVSARRGLSPSRHYERVGLCVWLFTSVLGVPHRARPRMAPHRLELAEFGGDLSREEFLAQERREDLFTSLEEPPAVSRRMLGNYTRPGVVCDLTRLGSSTGPVIMHGSEASVLRQRGDAPGMFEELVREYKPPQAAPQQPKRRTGLVLAVGSGAGSAGSEEQR